MSLIDDPNELRWELGLTDPPFPLNAYRRYLGVTIRTDQGVRSGGATIWKPDGTITVALPPGTQEVIRQRGSHELGHVANGDVGPHRRVLYARGSGRGAALNPALEERANNWGMDALIGRGPLGIAVSHDEIRTVDELARKFWVQPKFLTQAARRYGLDHLLLRNPEKYVRYLQSAEWIRRSKEILAARPSCERPLCGANSEFVHHLRFDRLGHELNEDVQVLCRVCSEDAELSAVVTNRQLSLLPEM